MSVIPLQTSGLAPPLRDHDRGQDIVAVEHLSKRFGRDSRRRRPDLPPAARDGNWLPGSQRSRQDNNTAHAAWTQQAHWRHCVGLRNAVPGDPEPCLPGRCRPGGNRLPSWPLGSRSPADARVRSRLAGPPGRRSPGACRAFGVGATAGRGLFPRDATATRARCGAARRSGASDPRRAGQWPGSRRGALAPRVSPELRRRGQDGPGFESCPRGGSPDGRRRPHHQPGQAGPGIRSARADRPRRRRRTCRRSGSVTATRAPARAGVRRPHPRHARVARSRASLLRRWGSLPAAPASTSTSSPRPHRASRTSSSS